VKPLLGSPRAVADAGQYQRLDAGFASAVRRSGWQGRTLLAGGEEVMDQSLLFWEEGKGGDRTLNLTLRLRRDSDRKVRDRLSDFGSLDVYRGSIPYPRKQIVAGEVHPLDRKWSLVAGTAIDAELDGVRVRYFPYETGDDPDSTPFSAQGSLTLVRDSARGQIEDVAGMLAVLSDSLGLDMRLSSVADLEYLYLRKIAWAMRLDGPDLETLLESLQDAPAAERVSALKGHLTRASGTDLAGLERYDWRPHFGSAYNPWASAIGSGEAGWPCWHRFDMERSLRGPLSQVYLGHDLAAHAPNIGDRIARIIRSTGYLLSSEERWMRLGTPSQSIYMPSAAAGAYVPLRLLRGPDEATLVFHPHVLRRSDHIAIAPGVGAEGLSPSGLKDRLPLDRCTAPPPQCEIYFKRGISLLDWLVRINLEQDLDRRKVLDAFRMVDIRTVRGIPVDSLVQVRETQTLAG